MLQFSCTLEPKEAEYSDHYPPVPMEEHSPFSSAGAPIVKYEKDKVEIYQIIKNTSDEIEKSFTTKNYQEEIDVQIFSNGLFQFDVRLRKNHPIPDWKYEGVDTLIAMSDVEGNYEALVSWLKGNNIITDDFKWSFGNNHLVLNGDMMDRGDEVFQVLWLIYKLEAESEEQGGRVHFVLGNHEQLNLQGFYDKENLKYVHPRYFKDATLLGIDYSKWLSDQTELGRWMRTKNAFIQINDELFVHGGISPKLLESELTIQEINDINRSAMNITYLRYNQSQSLIALGDGPLWYRGLADEELTVKQVLEILDHYHSKRIIIGHTIVHKGVMESLYNGSVIPIDLHLKKNFNEGIVKGILVTEGGIYELDNKRNKTALD
jgi:hypothetical protein